jgi:hypothetical protein
MYVQDKSCVENEEISAAEKFGGSFKIKVLNSSEKEYNILKAFLIHEREEVLDQFPLFPFLLDPGM